MTFRELGIGPGAVIEVSSLQICSPSEEDAPAGTVADRNYSHAKSKRKVKNRKNTKSTAWQGVRFSAAYFFPYLIIYVTLFYDMAGRTTLPLLSVDVSDAGYWFIQYWLAIVTPLLGAFNSIVYFYPRYTMHRKANSDKSRMACLCEVLGIDTSRCHCERRGTNAASETASTTSTPLISEEDIQTLL